MSIVPYRDTRRERKQLDRPQIVRAALALLDEVGLDGLTMRRLAETLGVQAASLYRHVRDKEELLVLLADEITAELPVAEIPTEEEGGAQGSWKEQLIKMAWRYRHVLLVHRDAARLFAITRPAGPRRLRQIEAMYDLLLSAGFPPRDAMRAGYIFNNFVTEFVADEVRMSMAAEALGISQGEFVELARDMFKALPADEYPNLTRYADFIVDDDAEGLFQFGIELSIAGLERLSRRSDPPGDI